MAIESKSFRSYKLVWGGVKSKTKTKTKTKIIFSPNGHFT